MLRSLSLLLLLSPMLAGAQVRGARTVSETNFHVLQQNSFDTTKSGPLNGGISEHRNLAQKGLGADRLVIETRMGMGMDSTTSGTGMGASKGTFSPSSSTSPTSAPAAVSTTESGMGGSMGRGTGGGMGMGAVRGVSMGMGSDISNVPVVLPVGIPIAATIDSINAGMGMGSATPTTEGMGMGMENRGSFSASSINFVQEVYDAAVAVEMPSPTLTEVGTVFTFRNYTTAQEFENLYGSGLCTRTGARTATERGISFCDFTYSIQDTEMSGFSVSGAVMDAISTTTTGLSGGGLLAITGGTGIYFGARGEISMTPYFELNVSGDIFVDASWYMMNATILL